MDANHPIDRPAAYYDGYRDGYAAAERDIAERDRYGYGHGSLTVNPVADPLAFLRVRVTDADQPNSLRADHRTVR